MTSFNDKFDVPGTRYFAVAKELRMALARVQLNDARRATKQLHFLAKIEPSTILVEWHQS